jgi:hypothetical protein
VRHSDRAGVGLAVGTALTWGTAFFFLGRVVGPLGIVLPILTGRVLVVAGHGAWAFAAREPMPAPTAAGGPLVAVALLWRS